MPAAGVIALVAGAIAGMLVLPPLGALLALVGGRPDEALAGGVSGLALGTAAGALGPGVAAGLAVGAGLLTGALVGTTFPLLVRLTRRVARAAGRRGVIQTPP
jgi:hypothetical protein